LGNTFNGITLLGNGIDVDVQKKAGVDINRKMLAELAVSDAEAFSDLVVLAKGQLDAAGSVQ